MPIMFNTILGDIGIAPSEVRLLRHQDYRAGRRRTPFELWRDDRSTFELYQSHQNASDQRRFGNVPYWVSFVGLPNTTETLFVGLYCVQSRSTLDRDKIVPYKTEPEKAGIVDVYDLRVDQRLSEFDGKLFVDWGSGTRAWIQRADQQNKKIIELRREFKEPDFPGFSDFIRPLSQIVTLPKGWVETLRASRGIYLLTCPRTKEQYVGSADGEDGFIGRWREYVQTGHGGNIALKSRDPSDYQISILEVAGSTASREDILKMEGRWKAKLQSTEMGLNRN
jgi:hypothetical protein